MAEHWRDVLVPSLPHSFYNFASALFAPQPRRFRQVFGNLAQDFSSFRFEKGSAGMQLVASRTFCFAIFVDA
jgi:hypothetical protein